MASTKLKGIYSNGMVLQRNKEIVIEGFESSAAEVKVTLADQSVTAKVEDGRFIAVLPPMDEEDDADLADILYTITGKQFDISRIRGKLDYENPNADVQDAMTTEQMFIRDQIIPAVTVH